jgi:hypothetical protein
MPRAEVPHVPDTAILHAHIIQYICPCNHRYAIENKPEKTEEDKSQIAKLYSAFGKLHGMSSLLNLVVLCAALAFGWQLSGALTL